MPSLSLASGTPLLRRVPGEQLIHALVRLVDTWLGAARARNGHAAGYTIQDLSDERSDEDLQAIAFGDAGDEQPEDSSGRVVVRVPGTLLELSGGADDIALSARSVGEALDALAQDHPDLVAYLRLDTGELNPAVNLYIREDDIRGLGGLDAPLEPGDELTILPALAGG
jgi:ferredoxin-nitrite reductase